MMTLLIKEDCVHCPQLIEMSRGKIDEILEVINHPDGTPHIKLDEKKFEPLPSKIWGLPALIVNERIYIGASVIANFFGKLATKGAHA